MENRDINWPGWETVRLIGRGSFGAVYEIQRDVFGEAEVAALKVISIPQNESDIEELYNDGYDDESITSTFQSHLKSIVAEYSLMKKLNGHANIVNCDDMRYVQHDDGIGWDIFIKMELLTPLAKALPAQITEKNAVKLAKDMCAALELCSKHNIIHRDIKPQNIFVSPHGDYKLGDFGIAKTVEKTMGGTKIGTYKYMAPEVYNNQPYGCGADIYSLGLVLYWVLNERRMPFLPLPPEKLKAGMEEEARQRRFRGDRLPPPAHGSEKLKAIVLKACAYDPAQRYHTAAEMLQDLEKLGAKPAMPELVATAALAPKVAPEVAPAVTPAPKQPAAQSAPSKSASVPELIPAADLSPVAQSYRQHYQQQHEKPQPKTHEQIVEAYRQNYQAQQEKQQKNAAMTEAEPGTCDTQRQKTIQKAKIAMFVLTGVACLLAIFSSRYMWYIMIRDLLIAWVIPGFVLLSRCPQYQCRWENSRKKICKAAMWAQCASFVAGFLIGAVAAATESLSVISKIVLYISPSVLRGYYTARFVVGGSGWGVVLYVVCGLVCLAKNLCAFIIARQLQPEDDR